MKRAQISFAISVFLLLLCACHVVAQAPIEPGLPEAPLPHRRVLFLFPGYETVQDPKIPVATLRTKQKFEMVYRKTVDPSFPVESLMFSGFDVEANYGPPYGSGPGPFGERFLYNAANLSSTYLFTDGLLPTMFHQDPRFFRKGEGSVKSRIWWSLRSEGVAFSDSGRQMPNYSMILGFGMSTALSNAYSPESSNTLGSTMQRYAVKFGVSFGLNLMREFGGLSRPERHQPPPAS